MSNAWIYIESIPETGDRCALEVREARHAIGSKRRQSGETVTVFDGGGVVADAVIVDVAKQGRRVTVEIRSRQQTPAPKPSLHLLSALPKGDRLSTMLNMATQVGMTSFTPLICERSVATPGGSWRVRAQRIMTEACKQCRRPHLPVINEPIMLNDLTMTDDVTLLADAAGRSLRQVCSNETRGVTSIAAIVGPEGGLTDAERDAICARGAIPINLGSNVLRIETAAVVVLSHLKLNASDDES